MSPHPSVAELLDDPRAPARGAIPEVLEPPVPPPAAIPPAAATITSNTSARPQFDPHGNGVRIGESSVPAPSQGMPTATAGTAQPAQPLHPLLARLMVRLVRAADVSDEEHEALNTRYRAWRDEALAAPLRAVVEAADEADRRYDAMYGEPASAHPDLPEATRPLDPAMARLLARLVEDDGYMTDSERHNLRTLLPLLRVHCRAWDYATPTPQTEPAGPAGDNDEADAQYEFTFGESARAYHPSPTPVPAPSPPTAMPPPTANIMPNAIERGAATLMHTDGTPLNNAEWAAVRRPLAPALQRLIMSSAPIRNDGTYDMTEQERLAQRARYRRITGAAEPAAVPPPAANAARSATASNGVHVGEARVPAPNADTSDADAPTPPPADTSARSALLRSRSPPARNERTRNQRHSRERRHRVLLELLAYEEGLLQDAWAAGRFGVERTLSLQGATLSLYPPTPGPPPPAPAAMPPVAAGATSNASARPQVDPHGNGVRIGEADTPAPGAERQRRQHARSTDGVSQRAQPHPGAAFRAPR